MLLRARLTSGRKKVQKETDGGNRNPRVRLPVPHFLFGSSFFFGMNISVQTSVSKVNTKGGRCSDHLNAQDLK
jgi:hypothetical protein